MRNFGIFQKFISFWQSRSLGVSPKSKRLLDSYLEILYPTNLHNSRHAVHVLMLSPDRENVFKFLKENNQLLFYYGHFLLIPQKISFLFTVLAIIYFLTNAYILIEEMEITNVGKSRTEKKVTFDDIIGIDEFKDELQQIVHFLKNRKQYMEVGATIPKGVLLSGPPGCGKTQMARAISSEANLGFYAVNASQLLNALVGVSPKIIMKLFEKARSHPKGAIIFIDEIDTLEARSAMGGYTNSILNALLTCMDGFSPSDNVIVIGATNRPKVLDPALTRSGRFDLKIDISLPFYDNRLKIINYYLEKIKKDATVDPAELAKLTVNFSPAEIKNLINLGALEAIKRKKSEVSKADLISAFQMLKMGIKNKNETSPEMLKKVALKEATKAVLSLHDPELPQVNTNSISTFDAERTGKGIYLNKIDAVGHSKGEILGLIEFFLAGKVAEEVLDTAPKLTSIATKDFERASSLAYRFVGELAFIEDFSLMTLEDRYLSEALRRRMEKKAEEVLNQCYVKAQEKALKYRDEILKVQGCLLEVESLNRSEIMQCLAGN